MVTRRRPKDQHRLIYSYYTDRKKVYKEPQAKVHIHSLLQSFQLSKISHMSQYIKPLNLQGGQW